MSIESLVTDLTGQTPPAALLQAWLDMLQPADACLEKYPEAQRDLAKAYAIAHMMMLQGGGKIESQRFPTGASQSYAQWQGQGTGLESTPFGAILLTIPGGDCLAAVLNKPKRFARSINPSKARSH